MSKEYRTIEFYNDLDEYEGAIRISMSVKGGDLQNEIWKVCSEKGWVHLEDDEDDMPRVSYLFWDYLL